MFEQDRQQVAAFKAEINALARWEILNELLEYFYFENIRFPEQLIRKLNISMISVPKG